MYELLTLALSSTNSVNLALFIRRIFFLCGAVFVNKRFQFWVD
jgi:hypothetical protein